MEKYYLSVFNICTGEYEDVEVTEEVYKSYRRMNWNAEKKEQEYRRWCTTFSSLKGGANGAYKNFYEFISDDSTPETMMMESIEKQCLRQAMKLLTEEEQKLIFYLFYQKLSEKAYAEIYGNSQQAISRRKQRLLCKLAKLLKEFEN
jgi:RNA polymerase sigma factor (sigma-70 family)